MYAITIKWLDGTITKAVVNRASLRAFRISACQGASISWVKQ
jgi:hypothetical protein